MAGSFFFSRISLCGSIGTPSVADAGVQHWPPFSLECSHHATGLIDEIWSSTVGQVNVDADGSSTASLLLIFAQLYRVSLITIVQILSIDFMFRLLFRKLAVNCAVWFAILVISYQ